MNKKSMSKVLWTTIALTILFWCLFTFVKNKNERATGETENSNVYSIKFNRTYTYDSSKDGSNKPSYIKFLDRSHYVAIPLLNVDDGEDDQGPIVTFIQGTYERDNGRIILGKTLHETDLNFVSYAAFKKGKYVLKTRNRAVTSSPILPFEDSYMTKRKGFYTYCWKNKSDYHDGKKEGFVNLQETKRNIPTTEKEFIHQYHQKQ